jgi:ELWxxDGT repeat protein
LHKVRTLVKRLYDCSPLMNRGARQPANTQRGSSRALRLETLENRRLLAATPQLVADVNQRAISAGSDPSDFVEFQGQVYFTAQTSDGRHLWKSDGTEEGTQRVATHVVNPAQLTAVGGLLYFAGTGPGTGIELWRTDGTAPGTTLVRDIRPGLDHSSPFALSNVGGMLYFAANDGIAGLELWKSDGSAAGTQLVKDANPGPEGSIRNGGSPDMTDVGGLAYFVANDGTTGYNLWRSDGTADGTFQLRDFHAEYQVSTPDPGEFVNLDGTLYFVAAASFDNAFDGGIWKTDGTVGGTVLVADLTSSGFDTSTPSSLTNHQGTLFFFQNPVGEVEGLWSLVNDVPQPVRDLTTNGLWPYPVDLTSHNGALYFASNVGSQAERGSGLTLWKSDGTEAGTNIVQDIRAAHAGTGFITTQPPGIIGMGDAIYVPVNQSSTGFELWKSDGTSSGTALVTEVQPGPVSGVSPYFPSPLVIGGTLYFRGNDHVAFTELWRTDGTAVGTALVANLATRNGSSWPHYFTDVDGAVYFSADDGHHGYELWKTDVGGQGATLVKDIRTGVGGSLNRNANQPSFAEVNGVLYFNANDGLTGGELWRSDGTTEGTRFVKDIHSGPSSSTPRYLTNVNGTLFFVAVTSANGLELWKSDGTADGTVLVRDIQSGANGAFVKNLVNVSGTLFFVATEPAFGAELWKSDGTTGGTVRVKDIRFGSGNSNPDELLNVSGTLYFVANDPSSGPELWRTDGTEAGTTLVKNINPGITGAGPRYLTNVNGTVFFTANSGSAWGYELWKSDGTAAGTILVNDIRPGVNQSGIDPTSPFSGPGFTPMGDLVFFQANDGTGARLWRSDGTAAGTVPVTLATPHGSPLRANYLTAVRGLLYFVTDPVDASSRLWRTDGTFQNTEPVEQLATFSWTSSRQGGPRLFNANGALYFMAEDYAHNRELWSVPALPDVAGDFNDDSRVDGHDFLAWQRSLGSSASPAGSGADGDVSGAVDAGDLAVWSNNFGATASLAASVTAAAAPSAHDHAVLDAIYAAGDFTGLFTPDARPARSFRPARRAFVAG